MPENSVRRAKSILRDGELCYELPLENGVVYRTPEEIASCLYHTVYGMHVVLTCYFISNAGYSRFMLLINYIILIFRLKI